MSNRKSPLYRQIPTYKQPRAVVRLPDDPIACKRLFGWSCISSFAISLMFMVAFGTHPSDFAKAVHTVISFVTVASFVGWVWYGYQTRDIKNQSNLRECIACGRVSEMPTVLRTSRGQLIALLLMFFWVLPGIIYIVYQWGRHRCNICGFVGRNFPHKPG